MMTRHPLSLLSIYLSLLLALSLLSPSLAATPKPLPLHQQLGLFPKIGKRANDLLRKVPAIPQVDMEMPSIILPDGSNMKLRTSFDIRSGREGRREGGRVVGGLTWRLRKTLENQLFPTQPAGLEVRGGVESGLENDFNVGVDYRLTPSFKLSTFCLSRELLEASSSAFMSKLQDIRRGVEGGVGAEYSNDLVSLAVTKPFQNSKLHFSALAGAGGWAGGVQGRHNPRARRGESKITDTKLAVQYSQDDLQFSCQFTDDLEEALFTLHHELSPSLELAASGKLHERSFTLGFMHQIDPGSSLKAVVDSSGSLNAAYTATINRSLSMRLVGHVTSLLGNAALYGIPPPRVALQFRGHFP